MCMSELTEVIASADGQKINSLDHLQTLKNKLDLDLNYFFIEKCIPGIFPYEILEKKKQITDIHVHFWSWNC